MKEPQEIKPLKLEVPILHMAIIDTLGTTRSQPERGDAGDTINITDSTLLSVTSLLDDRDDFESIAAVFTRRGYIHCCTFIIMGDSNGASGKTFYRTLPYMVSCKRYVNPLVAPVQKTNWTRPKSWPTVEYFLAAVDVQPYIKGSGMVRVHCLPSLRTSGLLQLFCPIR
ncbi:hypothetical protein evm_011218 [Chilo suppressalis]|nr:hypothetical protein evm_011218 [Chilo suppressalis]